MAFLINSTNMKFQSLIMGRSFFIDYFRYIIYEHTIEAAGNEKYAGCQDDVEEKI
jgi:hypothetical protein